LQTKGAFLRYEESLSLVERNALLQWRKAFLIFLLMSFEY
jgi:hypothetical protein